MEDVELSQSVHLDWGGIFELKLAQTFDTLSQMPSILAPLTNEFEEVLGEWIMTPTVLQRLRSGMAKMATLCGSHPHPAPSSTPDTEYAQEQRREVLVAVEEVRLMSGRLVELLRAIDTKHFQCGSVRRRKDVQLLMNSLYRMLKFLYLRWLSELGGYRDFCQHRALTKTDGVEAGSGGCDEKLSEEDADDGEYKEEKDDSQEGDREGVASSDNHYDSELWKELEGIEGNVTDQLALLSSEAATFWKSTFREPLKFMVSWEDFLYGITTHLGCSLTPSDSDNLANLLDPARSEMVSILRFRDFLKGFSPFPDCLTKFVELAREPWYHSYMSHNEAERLLEGEPPGTFLVRHINILPGSLAIALAHSTAHPAASTILHTILYNHEEATKRKKQLKIAEKGKLSPGGFSVEQDGKLWHFESVPSLVNHFKSILVLPYTMSLIAEPWFYSDLSSQEAIQMLTNQHGGTFLLRFSSRMRSCLAIAYVGRDGQILNSLIEKVTDKTGQRVYRQKLDHVPADAVVPTFPSVNEFIEAHQSLLAIPFSDTFSVVRRIEEEATEIVNKSERLLPSKSETKDVLWRRSTALNSSSGSLSGGVTLGRRRTGSLPLRSQSGRHKRVFGSDLITAMDTQRQRDLWLSQLDIPLFADQLIRCLNMYVAQEGLFRISDSSTEAKHLIEKINRGTEVDLFALNKPHLVAMLLKTYLRELERPLIIPELFSEFICINESTPLERVSGLLAKLPTEHLALLKHLLKLLYKVASEPSAKMTPLSLAVCIGHPILRQTDNACLTLEASLATINSVEAACTLLIKKAPALFPGFEELSLDYIESQDIVLMPSRRQIKSATAEALIRAIYTCPKGLIPSAYANYVNVFLLTYHSWTSAAEVLGDFTKLYHELSPQPEINKLALMRIFAFLKKWTREQFYEFHDDPRLLEAYEQFVVGSKDVQVLRAVAPTLSKIKAGKGEVKHMFSEAAPKPRLPNKRPLKSVLHVSPLELARQMALIEYDIFARIRPIELLEKAWMEQDKAKRAPNVMALVSHFNQSTRWFVTQMVSEESARKRESIMEHIIKVAQCCRALNNFNGVQEIMAAFSSSSVSRLLQAKRLVQSPGFLELKELLESSNNFGKYRRAVRDANPPLVPYLGRFLTDLNFIEDANKIRISSNGHINFRKCYLVADVILELQRYQQTPYNLTPVPVVRDFLLDTSRILSEEEAYQRSRVVQPRKVTVG